MADLQSLLAAAPMMDDVGLARFVGLSEELVATQRDGSESYLWRPHDRLADVVNAFDEVLIRADRAKGRRRVEALREAGYRFEEVAAAIRIRRTTGLDYVSELPIGGSTARPPAVWGWADVEGSSDAF